MTGGNENVPNLFCCLMPAQLKLLAMGLSGWFYPLLPTTCERGWHTDKGGERAGMYWGAGGQDWGTVSKAGGRW